MQYLNHTRLLLAAVLAAVPISTALSADAGGVVVRTSSITTDNCNDAGGLCQAVNPVQPGGNNPDTINATVRLNDNGAIMYGFGSGSGFTFGRTYVSLLYLNPNVATCARFPAGQAALTANTANADNDFASMFLGFWAIDPRDADTPGAARGYFAVYPGKPSPIGNINGGTGGLGDYATVSVREAAGGFLAGNAADIANNIAAGRDIPPNIFQLKACGSLVAA